MWGATQTPKRATHGVGRLYMVVFMHVAVVRYIWLHVAVYGSRGCTCLYMVVYGNVS